MRRVATRVLAAAASLVVGVLLTTTPASASPRIPLEPFDVTLAGGVYCDFPVRVTATDFNQYIIRQSTAPNGDLIVRITGRARVTATNLTTGEAVSYNISGPGTAVLDPNDFQILSADLHGPNLLWTERELSFPGVPPLSFTTGHVTFTTDRQTGETTSYSLSGRRTDVCAVLAS